MRLSAETSGRTLLYLAALLFGVLVFGVSWWRWWTFRYETFDLAFYVQSLSLALRGQWEVSLLRVPMLGNHAEPIVFLLTPVFALWPHPMLFVVVQTIALASLPFTAWRLSRHFGLPHGAALPLALSTLVMPATLYVGLHEFHPEALAAPLLLLTIEARLRERRSYYLWWLLTLWTKENVALLLVVWGAVQGFAQWRRDPRKALLWDGLPMIGAALWVAGYALVLGPLFNGGRVDYGELYSHLRGPEPGLAATASRAITALLHSVSVGNLLPALFLPLLGFPILRWRWMLVCAPIFGQHLLSWRASEWTIHFHYAAPLVPLLWVATVEVVQSFRRPVWVAWTVFGAAALGQVLWGPGDRFLDEVRTWKLHADERQSRLPLVEKVAANPEASVTASNGFLAHLAHREHLYSLHHLLKGLQTLSRRGFQPPPATDYVLIDSDDRSTFDRAAGFYHMAMRTVAGDIVPSSDQLLATFLQPYAWSEECRNSLSLFTKGSALAAPPEPQPGELRLTATRRLAVPGGIGLETTWSAPIPAGEYPWVKLIAVGPGGVTFERDRWIILTSSTRPWTDRWSVTFPGTLPPGRYDLKAIYHSPFEEEAEAGGIRAIVPLGPVDLPLP